MLTIYGASDDLIEIEGALNEEFNVYPDDDKDLFLACSDGALWRVTYDKDGIWRFTSAAIRIPDGWSKTEGRDPEDDYTDRLTCHHALIWVALATHRVCGPKQ